MKTVRSAPTGVHLALYALVTLAGLGLYFAGPPQPVSVAKPERETLEAGRMYPVGEASGLRFGPVTRLIFPDEKTLRVGEQEIRFEADSTGRIRFETKEGAALGYLIANLNLASDGMEEQFARQKIRMFSRKNLPDSLRSNGQTDVAQFIRALREVEKKAEQTFILDGELHTGKIAATRLTAPVQILTGTPPPAATATAPSRPWPAALVALAGLAGLAVTAFGRKTAPPPVGGYAAETPPPVPVQAPELVAPLEPAEPVVTAPEPAPPAPSPPPQAFLETYATRFLARYGAFFDELQRVPVLPDEAEAQRARQRLVEMGLHAHALARTVYLDRLTPETAEPNVLLVLNDWRVSQLDPARYRPLTDDPYQTEKRYRMLLPILQDLDLGRLDGALLDDVAVSETQLKPSR